MTNPMTFLLGLVFLLAAIVAHGIDFSGSTVAEPSAAMAPVTAAADGTPPTDPVSGPDAPVQNRISVTAAAPDGDSDVASVAIQYLAPAASTWVTICTDRTAPYHCSWNTEPGPRGGYDLRAHAVDGAGHTMGSVPINAIVTTTETVPGAESGD